MQLLFVLSGHACTEDILGMAQLSAAFGQQVYLWHPHGSLTQAQHAACAEAGITQLASEAATLKQWLASAERVVRL